MRRRPCAAENDNGNGIAVDCAGNAYVAGVTSSNDFPVKVGPNLFVVGGHSNAFVAKVKADGSGTDYAGFIGGPGEEYGAAIAVDGGGNACVTGSTNSDQARFPVKVGPDLTFNGGLDAFIAKVKRVGTGLAFAGYIGGSGTDAGTAIGVDRGGETYVLGSNTSSQATFPVTNGPDLTLSATGGRAIGDAFVTMVTANGSGLQYAGYIDAAAGVAVNSHGLAYVAGYSCSSQATFPVLAGPGLAYKRQRRCLRGQSSALYSIGQPVPAAGPSLTCSGPAHLLAPDDPEVAWHVQRGKL